MRIAQVAPSISRLGGGMYESVRHLSAALINSFTVEVAVFALSDSKSAEDLRYWGTKINLCTVRGPKSFGYAPAMAGDLIRWDPDVVHLHGLWKYPSVAVSICANGTWKPYVVSPRGMLEPWALQRSRVRKQIALALFQRRNLRMAACIHATSKQEAHAIRAAGYTNPIAVIPNGVPLQKIQDVNPRVQDVRRALFLSRVHPKKGLLNLVESWNHVRPVHWVLDVVGPDEKNHRDAVRLRVEQYKLGDKIRFHDEALGEAKSQFYRNADLFVLPSFSENFGLAIAEALSFGVPVITTRATPWSELVSHRCGWWIDPNTENLTAALIDATSVSAETLREMGSRGRELVRRNYSWEAAAANMVQVYSWILGKTSMPPCVVQY